MNRLQGSIPLFGSISKQAHFGAIFANRVALLGPAWPVTCSILAVSSFLPAAVAAALTMEMEKATKPQRALQYFITTIAAKASTRALLIRLRCAVPVDVFHECIDVCGGFRAVVDVIGMLVHIEREDRRRAR
jgi:hypothetical protein